jgi:hypothetical protein
MMQVYLLILSGLGWLVASMLIFRFIITVADGDMKNIKYGIAVIVLSYVAGAGLLFLNMLSLYSK